MAGNNVVEIIRPWAEKFAEESDCVLWDIKFQKEAGEWCLKVTLDTVPPGQVTLDMCESVNRLLDTKLDELDPIEQQYTLEVSSPGINRELYRNSDYDLFMGAKVDIRLFKKNEFGEKEFTAVLVSREENKLTVSRNDENMELQMSEIALCRIHYDFE